MAADKGGHVGGDGVHLHMDNPTPFGPPRNRVDDRFAVGRTSGYPIPHGYTFEVEYVVHDRAQASQPVGWFIARGREGSRTLHIRASHAGRMARRLAAELNAQDRGQEYDAVVVDGLPRVVHFPPTQKGR